MEHDTSPASPDLCIINSASLLSLSVRGDTEILFWLKLAIVILFFCYSASACSAVQQSHFHWHTGTERGEAFTTVADWHYSNWH